MEKNFVVEKNGKSFVFKRFVEALSFEKDVEKETGKSVAILQQELPINSKYDLEKGELIMNQNEVNNEALAMPEVSNEAKKTVWLTIPKATVGKEFEVKDKNDKPHTYVFINILDDENSQTSFSVLAKQVLPHPFIKEFCSIPISEYGLNLCHSIKVEIPPIAISGDTKLGPQYEWKRDDEINHLEQAEAVDFLSKKYSNMNNKETKYLLLPKEACKEITSDTAKNKGKINVTMPEYMAEHNGFEFANSNFIVNKVYHLADNKLGGMRAVQCSPNATFRVYGNDERYIDVKAKELYELNKEDFTKHKESAKGKDAQENGNTDVKPEPTIYDQVIEESANADIHSTLEEDAKNKVAEMEVVEKETEAQMKEAEKEGKSNGIDEYEDDGLAF